MYRPRQNRGMETNEKLTWNGSFRTDTSHQEEDQWSFSKEATAVLDDEERLRLAPRSLTAANSV
jgi:hypothetical protein